MILFKTLKFRDLSTPLVPILIFALLIRLAVALIPSESSNDEVFQYLERAYRLTFGYGVVTWEDRVGLRAGFIPVLLSVPMRLGALNPASSLYLSLTKSFICMLSLSIVASSFYIGKFISERHGIWAAIIMSFWPMVVYFSVHAQSETIALALFFPACAILMRNFTSGSIALFCAGMLISLTVIARIQMAPIVLTILIYFLIKHYDVRRALYLFAGIAGALLLSGLFDMAIDKTPLTWAYQNVYVNLYQGKAASFGTQPFYYYLLYFAMEWGAAALPITILAIIGSRNISILLVMPAVHLLVHSLIGHKEIRFILPVEAFVILAAALGTVDILSMRGINAHFRPWSSLVALCLWGWSAVSTAAGEMNRYRWTEGWNRIEATKLASAAPNICGLGIYRTDVDNFAGYVTLHKRTDIYVFNPGATPENLVDGEFSRNRSAFNVIFIDKTMASNIPKEYRQLGCRAPIIYHPGTIDVPQNHTYCIYHRAGTCIPQLNSPYLINRYFAQTDR